MISWPRLYVSILAIGLLAGCGAMKPEDFQGQEPRLTIENYFHGKVKAWGVFEDRFGTLRRQFDVDIDGNWDGNELVLDERFVYKDGERDRRIWRITKIDEHTYEGRADDILGTATGRQFGNALNWRYDMILNIKGTDVKVHFNDWMYLQSDGMLLNRARVSKWGIKLGEVTLAFRKVTDQMAEAHPPQLRAVGD